MIDFSIQQISATIQLRVGGRNLPVPVSNCWTINRLFLEVVAAVTALLISDLPPLRGIDLIWPDIHLACLPSMKQIYP